MASCFNLTIKVQSTHTSVLRQLGRKNIKQWNNELNNWWANIWRNMSWSLLHISSFWLIACQLLLTRWSVCMQSWLTVSGSRRFSLHYRPLSMLLWAAVRHFSPCPDIQHLAKWQRDDWILCCRNVSQRKRFPVCSRADAWCDWVVLETPPNPPSSDRLPLVTMVTAGLVTCVEWEGGELVTS